MNQTSVPSGDQASPCGALEEPRDRTHLPRAVDERHGTAVVALDGMIDERDLAARAKREDGRSSRPSRTGTLPDRDTPAGSCPPCCRTTARFWPSGAQSAHWTSSRISFGVPPPVIPMRASVPVRVNGIASRGGSARPPARPDAETDKHLRQRQAEGPRLRAVEARDEDLDGLSVPAAPSTGSSGRPERSAPTRSSRAGT